MKAIFAVWLTFTMMFLVGMQIFAKDESGVLKVDYPIVSSPIFVLINNTNKTYKIDRDADWDDSMLYYFSGKVRWPGQNGFASNCSVALKANSLRQFPIQFNDLGIVAVYPTDDSKGWNWECGEMDDQTVEFEPTYSKNIYGKSQCTGIVVIISDMKNLSKKDKSLNFESD